MTSDRALSELMTTERALALAAIHDKYVKKEPVDDEDMLAVMLAWRAVNKRLDEDNLNEVFLDAVVELEELIEKMVSELPHDASRRAAVIANRRAQEWLKELEAVLNDD